MAPSASTPTAAGDALPSQGVRTLVSFLLFVHLFALATGLVSNVSEDWSSPLERNLATVTRPYLQALAMDVPYRFHLTQADDLDVDFTIEVDLKKPDGTTVTETFPTPDMTPGIRYRRYGLLAWHVAQRAHQAELDGDDSMSGVLPRAIAAALFVQTGATEGTLRCRGHRLRTRSEIESGDPTRSDPFSDDRYYTKYPAKVWLSAGHVQVLKESPTAESAPAVAPSTSPPPDARGPASVVPALPFPRPQTP